MKNSEGKIQKEQNKKKDITLFSRRSFLQLSSFLSCATFLQLLIPKKAKAFGVFGLMRQGTAATPYVDDVFSAYTYTGNGATQTITNGIDLSGKGGVVWTKTRDARTYMDHILFDTARGINYWMMSNTTGISNGVGGTLTNYNSNGFDLGAGARSNESGGSYVAWTFRKAAKFFDILTWTGDGASSKLLSHNLGVVPGLVIVKATSTTGNWQTVARDTNTNYLMGNTATDFALNLTNIASAGMDPTGVAFAGAAWLTATQIDVAKLNSASGSTFNSAKTNTNGVTYVAYLFAHDTSANGIVQCGSYTGNGSVTGPIVTLGWEPQYLLIKNISQSGNGWYINDCSRGMDISSNSALLACENTGSESVGTLYTKPTATGFQIATTSTGFNNNGNSFIYLAIRRPNKPPTSGTQVYNAIARTGTGVAAMVNGVGFAPDLLIASTPDGGWWGGKAPIDRLRGVPQNLNTTNTAAERTQTTLSINAFTNDGLNVTSDTLDGYVNYSSMHYLYYFLKRAPGVFDIVCYTGTGALVSQGHNLGVVPELIINKSRASGSWFAYKPSASAGYAAMETGAAFAGSVAVTATSTTFDPISYASAVNFISYLFASKAGISKVGGYNGTNASQNIDCGFTAGPRFLMIKRTDAVGDWYVWDSTRGITTLAGGNDPHLSLNTTAAEVTTDDSIDTYISGSNSGFTVKQNATTNLNLYLTVSTASYIYLAIA